MGFATVLLPFYCRFIAVFLTVLFTVFLTVVCRFILFVAVFMDQTADFLVFTPKSPPRPDRFLTVFFAVFFPDPGPFFGGSPGGVGRAVFLSFSVEKGGPRGLRKKRQKNAPVVFLDH